MPTSWLRYGILGMLLASLIAIVYVLTQAMGDQNRSNRLEKLAVGSMASADFAFAGETPGAVSFLDPTGEPTTLEAFRGKTVLVNFWATWCPPCVKELPSLAALQTARGGANFQVVTISVDQPPQLEAARKQLNNLSGGVLAFYQAPEFKLAYEVGATIYPTTVLYGPDGIELARFVGDAVWDDYQAIALIDAAIEDAAN